MPLLQIVRADQPEPILGQTADGQIAHQLAAEAEHRCEAHAPDRGQTRPQQSIEPRGCAGATDFVACVHGGIKHARRFTGGVNFLPDEGMRVRATDSQVLDEVGATTREELWRFHAPVAAEACSVRGELIVNGRGLERSAGG